MQIITLSGKVCMRFSQIFQIELMEQYIFSILNIIIATVNLSMLYKFYIYSF